MEWTNFLNFNVTTIKHNNCTKSVVYYGAKHANCQWLCVAIQEKAARGAIRRLYKKRSPS